MRVQINAADKGGCGYYRLRWPAQTLIDQGYEVSFSDELPAVMMNTDTGPEIVGIDLAPDIEVVVLQRPLRGQVADAIPVLQAQGVAVVVEIDDDFHSLHRFNPAYQQTDPDRHPDYNRDHLARACHLADRVTVTTKGLADRYAPHGRVSIIPNYVRERWLTLEHAPPQDPPRVGWTGAVATHRNDLDVLGATIAEVVDTHGWQFRAIGSHRTGQKLGLDPDGHEVTPWSDLTTDDYPNQIGQLSLGIVPLAETAFNRAKSWLKGIEYAACGVPFVASDVADYRQLARRLTFPLAHNRREWAAHLGYLIEHDDLRSELAARNRAALRGLTIETNAYRWWEAWTKARDRRARR